MKKQKLTIDSIETLLQFRNKVFSSSRRAFTQIEFVMPSNSKDTNETITTSFNHLFFACGCAEATILGSISIAGYFAWRFPFIPGELGLLDLGIVLFLFSCFSVVGKLVGLRRAKNRLISEIDSLCRQYGVDEKVFAGAPLSQV
jgi:hypothetical protein